MKTKLLKGSIFFFFVATTLTACKKGENDPFMSLKSRDSRITGTWKLVDMETSEIDVSTSSGVTITSSTTDKYDGSLVTETSTDPSGTATYTYSYTLTITIDKSGSYSLTYTIDGDKTEQSGSWWWLNDTKKKTRICMDDDANSFEVDRLTNKELTLLQDMYSKDTYASDGSTDETTMSTMMKFEKQK